MKKILSLIAIIAVTMALLVACAPAAAPQAAIGLKPWLAHRNFKSEKCVYKVTKYVGDGSEAVTTDGELIYNLVKTSDSEYLLTMDFSLTYGNSEFIDGAFRGKTDSIHSEAAFKTSTLGAIRTIKTVNCQSDPTLSYSYEVDYVTADSDDKLTAYFTDAFTNTKQIKFAKGDYFDNDYLYYYVRTLEKMSGSFNENINVINWYDSFRAGKPVVYPLIASCANKYENVKIDNASLFGKFVPTEETPVDSQNNLVSAFNVSIVINGIKTGSVLNAFYSRNNYECSYIDEGGEQKSAYSKLIPLKYTSKEPTPPNYIKFYTDYILSDYSIEL